MELILSPQRMVAPVGSEVVLLAGVRGSDRYLRTNQRVEWAIGPGGVGQFVDLGKTGAVDWLLWDFNRPRKLNATMAIGSTSRKYLRLTRGTSGAEDDVYVLRGQAWITVTSPVEGTSQVTAYSPCIRSWPARTQTSTIHWVDVQVQFPSPSINPAGSRHIFTTTVTRYTNQSPCVNWLVRYTILNGPAAGFAPDGVQTIEVPTNSTGQASAEIFQQQPAAGTNQVGIEVFRPGSLAGGGGERFVVSRGTTLKTWSAADVSVGVTGPARVNVGAAVRYTIVVSNPGDLAAENVILTDEVPQGLTYVQSTPAGEVTGRTIRWQLGTLGPAETRSVEVEFKADRQGSVTHCAEAATAEGRKARDCATTTVGLPPVDVRIERVGPAGQLTVGDEVTFRIVVTNRGRVPAAGLLLKDRFESGLEHAEAQSPIERELPELGPGRSQEIGIAFRVTKAGRLCHTAEVISSGAVLASTEACVTVDEPRRIEVPPEREPEAGRSPPIPPVGPGPAAPRVGTADVTLVVTGETTARTVGETAMFTIEVVNNTLRPLENLKVFSNLDPSLAPGRATGGYQGFEFVGDAMFWVIDTLPPGEPARFEVEADCERPGRTYNRFRVAGDQGTLAEEELWIEVRPAPVAAPANLSISVDDLYDPITVRKELTYKIDVSNRGEAPDHRVVVEVTVPPEMIVVALGTVGPGGRGYEIVDTGRAPGGGQTIRFEPVEQIGAGEDVEYRVHVLANRPGVVRLMVGLTSEGLQQPITDEEETLIIAER